MKVIAADSAVAVLNEKFETLSIVAAAAVQVDSPYREACAFMAEPIFVNAQNVHEVIVHEAELCRDLIGKIGADVVHLDMSLGACPVEELSPIQLTNMRISTRARQHLLKVLPKLRKIATEITQKHNVEVLAIGKESMPVRVAELTSGAYAILYACEKVIEEKRQILLGLPSSCQPRIGKGGVYLHSLMAAEHDVRGHAYDAEGILNNVNIAELLNPCARGFRALRINRKI